MKVKNVMFSGFAAAVLAFACNSADAAVQLATKQLVETKQDKLDARNVTKDGTGKIVTGVTAAEGVVTVAHGDLAVADVTGLQAALDEKQVKLSVGEDSAIKISEEGLISLEGIATSDELTNIQNAMKVDGQIVTQATQDAKISALETKVGDTSVTQTITNALTTGKYVKEGDDVSLLTNDAGYLTEATATTAGFAKTSAIPTKVADLTDAASYVTDNELTQKGYAVASEVTTALAGKQATITDLETIRDGAELGATAVQPDALTTRLNSYVTSDALNAKGYATTGYVDDAETAAVNTAKDYTDDEVATRVAGAAPVAGTYLVSSNGTNVTWTAVEVIGANGKAMTLSPTANGENSSAAEGQ